MGSTGPSVSIQPWTPSRLWKLRTLSSRKARHTNTVNAVLGGEDPAAVQGPNSDIPQVQCGLGLRRSGASAWSLRTASEGSSCSAVRPSGATLADAPCGFGLHSSQGLEVAAPSWQEASEVCSPHPAPARCPPPAASRLCGCPPTDMVPRNPPHFLASLAQGQISHSSLSFVCVK